MFGNFDLISIITIAFLGSFGHCIGMCGGIVVAYSSTKIGSDASKVSQSLSHILYSLGRITTYSILGFIFGSIGSVVTLNNTTNAILLFIAGIAMVLTGLSLIGKVKFLTIIEHTLTNSSWYKNNFRNIMGSNTKTSFYLIGLLNGLLPCGFVYFFAIAAAASANAFSGAIIMLVFGLSTIPALFSLGFFVSVFKNSNIRSLFVKLAAILVLCYGGFTLYKGFMLLQRDNASSIKVD